MERSDLVCGRWVTCFRLRYLDLSIEEESSDAVHDAGGAWRSGLDVLPKRRQGSDSVMLLYPVEEQYR
jgi:hypothetical protein